MKNYFSLNSMSKKLLFILMSVALISTATVTAVFSAYELKTAKQEQTQSLKSLSQILAPNISTALIFYDTAAIKELIEPLLMRSDIVSVEVINNFSQQLASVTSPKYSQESSAPHTIEVKTPLTIDAQRYGTLIVRADDSDLNDRAAFYGRFIIVLMIFSFILSLLVSLMLRKRFLNPILYLAQTAEKITSSNDYSLRAKELSKDEVGKLTSCFNTMLQTIEQRDNLLENQVKRRTKELENANVQ
ncbi:MAG: CHASE sensor domain-containing protein, partial [Pseudomonadota bacterium]|nr:CHASE sensor domain-containing protein [Pseudomonadota bacterium]